MAFERCKYINLLNTHVYMYIYILAKHILFFEGCDDFFVRSFSLKCSLISNNYYYL